MSEACLVFLFIMSFLTLDWIVATENSIGKCAPSYIVKVERSFSFDHLNSLRVTCADGKIHKVN